MQLGHYLKETRLHQNLSIRKLAALSGVSHSEISKIETGVRPSPLPYTLYLLSKTLNIPSYKLLFLAGYLSKKDYLACLSCDQGPTFDTLLDTLKDLLPTLTSAQKNSLLELFQQSVG